MLKCCGGAAAAVNDCLELSILMCPVVSEYACLLSRISIFELVKLGIAIRSRCMFVIADQFRGESACFIREPIGLISENLWLYPDNCSAVSY
jgi:hypothetical protein